MLIMFKSICGTILISQLLCPLQALAQVNTQTRMILFGGRAMPEAATRLAAKWGRVHDPVTQKLKRGKLLIVGLPSQIPNDYFDSISHEFKTAASFTDADILTLPEINSSADRERFIELFHQASMVYFTGGDQTRAMNTLKAWKLVELVRAGLHTKIYISKSAGTAMSAHTAISGTTTRPIEGLGLLNAIVDTHFLKRDREGRIMQQMREENIHYGIGVDEDGALAFDGTFATVIGEKDMMFYELKHAGTIEKHRLSPGRVFELSRFSAAPLRTLGCSAVFNK